MSITYCLLEIVMLQKIRKNKDASHKEGHFLEIRILIFSKTWYCKIRTNLRSKDGMAALPNSFLATRFS